MKTLLLASALTLIISTSVVAEAMPSGESVGLVSSKFKNLFVFKAKKKFVGATVEIYSSNGEMITSQHLQKRKVIIDFDDARFGTYTIRIEKGNNMQEFHYVKK